MYVIQLSNTDEGKEGLDNFLGLIGAIMSFVEHGNTLLDIRVGIEPDDNGVRFSVNGRTWSPPAEGKFFGPGEAEEANDQPPMFVARGTDNIARIERTLRERKGANDG